MIRSQDGGRGAAALPPERPSHAPSEPPACAESLAREGTPVAAQGPSSDEEEADSSGASSLPARGQPGGAGGGPGALAGAGGHCHGRRAAGPPRAGRLLDFLPPTSRSQQDCDGLVYGPDGRSDNCDSVGPGTCHCALWARQGPFPGSVPEGAPASGGGTGQAELDAGPQRPPPGASTSPWGQGCSGGPRLLLPRDPRPATAPLELNKLLGAKSGTTRTQNPLPRLHVCGRPGTLTPQQQPLPWAQNLRGGGLGGP